MSDTLESDDTEESRKMSFWNIESNRGNRQQLENHTQKSEIILWQDNNVISATEKNNKRYIEKSNVYGTLA